VGDVPLTTSRRGDIVQRFLTGWGNRRGKRKGGLPSEEKRNRAPEAIPLRGWRTLNAKKNRGLRYSKRLK